MAQVTRRSRIHWVLILAVVLVVAVTFLSRLTGPASDRALEGASANRELSPPIDADAVEPTHWSTLRDAELAEPESRGLSDEPVGSDSRSPAPATASKRDLEIERWRSQIERRLAAFEVNTRDLDRVHDLVLECILARLELEFRFHEHGEGARAPLSADGETQTVMRSGPSGTRSYSIRRDDYPLYFEIVKYFDPANLEVALVPHNSVPKALSARAAQFATDVLERLQ